jgi:hypothetical protein
MNTCFDHGAIVLEALMAATRTGRKTRTQTLKTGLFFFKKFNLIIKNHTYLWCATLAHKEIIMEIRNYLDIKMVKRINS